MREVASDEASVAGVKRDVEILKWMVGTNIALTVAVLAALLRVLAR